nr:immunoglobulin light chain junction region [Macaca mulatta]
DFYCQSYDVSLSARVF